LDFRPDARVGQGIFCIRAANVNIWLRCRDRRGVAWGGVAARGGVCRRAIRLCSLSDSGTRAVGSGGGCRDCRCRPFRCRAHFPGRSRHRIASPVTVGLCACGQVLVLVAEIQSPTI